MTELEQRFPEWEVSIWELFYDLEGWPEVRADYRTAYVASTVASSVGARTKLRDFIPLFDSPPPQDWRVSRAQFEAAAAMQEARKQLGK